MRQSSVRLAFVLSVVSNAAMAASITVSPSTGAGQTAINAAGGLDFKAAKPMPLPQAGGPAAPSAILPKSLGNPGSAPGNSQGNAVPVQTQIVPALDPSALSGGGGPGITPQQFGTSNQVYTTSRVNLTTPTSPANQQPTVYSFPYRASGKLFFKDGASTYVCSASLIKRGVVVTAAHCVAAFGKRRFYTAFQFVPAYNNGAAPYGVWTVQAARVLNSYYDGTDSCYQTGVVCKNDVAVLTLTPQSGAYPGTSIGWLGYAWDGYGYNSSGQVLINELGYPVNLDKGVLEQRTDSQGFTNATFSNNTVIGSLMTGGSSGGPWVENLGIQPVSSTGYGTGSNQNVVVGVTSWGYVSASIQQQGASRFTSGNIVPLVNSACAATPAAC